MCFELYAIAIDRDALITSYLETQNKESYMLMEY